VEPRAGLEGGGVDRGEVLRELVLLLRLLLLLELVFDLGGVGNRCGRLRRRRRFELAPLRLLRLLRLLLLLLLQCRLLRGGHGAVAAREKWRFLPRKVFVSGARKRTEQTGIHSYLFPSWGP